MFREREVVAQKCRTGQPILRRIFLSEFSFLVDFVGLWVCPPKNFFLFFLFLQDKLLSILCFSILRRQVISYFSFYFLAKQVLIVYAKVVLDERWRHCPPQENSGLNPRQGLNCQPARTAHLRVVACW